MTTYSLVTTDDDGHVTTQDVTGALETAAMSAGALARAVQERMSEKGEAADDALENLTADYTRAEIEESGHDALQGLMDVLSIRYDPMPEDGDPTECDPSCGLHPDHTGRCEPR